MPENNLQRDGDDSGSPWLFDRNAMTLPLLSNVNSMIGNILVANSGKRELADVINQLSEVSIRIVLLTPGIHLRADGIDPGAAVDRTPQHLSTLVCCSGIADA
jgi:hypothetical protein